MNLTDRIADIVHNAKTPLHDHGQSLAREIVAEFGLTVDRRAVSGTLPQFGGQPAYYNPDAAKNGGAIGAHIASLPVEFRVVGEWRPEETDD